MQCRAPFDLPSQALRLEKMLPMSLLRQVQRALLYVSLALTLLL